MNSVLLAQILVQTIQGVFRILFWLIFIRAILSWLGPAAYRNSLLSEISRVLYVLTEPILAPIRNLMPGGGMGLDFSPFIAMILLNLLQGVVTTLIYRLFS